MQMLKNKINLLLNLTAFCGIGVSSVFSNTPLDPVLEWHISADYPIYLKGEDKIVLAGQIEDLSAFAGIENPFEWGIWPDVPYDSVAVKDGVLVAKVGEAGTRPARIISSPLAWWLDMDQFRYLEIEFSREQSIGNGHLWFRKNGNSVVTPGQNALFRISDGHHGDRIRLILDLKKINSWGEGALTGLGLDFHVGAGPSRNNTIDRIYSIRIATDISHPH